MFSGFFSSLSRSMDILSGAIDIVVIEQEDGSFKSSPWHVRFGTLKIMRSHEKKIKIMVNGKLTDIVMKIGDKGEAYFVHEAEGMMPSYLITSPLNKLSPNQLSPKSDEEISSSLEKKKMNIDLNKKFEKIILNEKEEKKLQENIVQNEGPVLWVKK
jgi:phosphatidate phosphatase LPIN